MRWEILKLQGSSAIFTLISLFFSWWVGWSHARTARLMHNPLFPIYFCLLISVQRLKNSLFPAQFLSLPLLFQPWIWIHPCNWHPWNKEQQGNWGWAGNFPGISTAGSTQHGQGFLVLAHPWFWFIWNILGDLSQLNLSPTPSHGYIFPLLDLGAVALF